MPPEDEPFVVVLGSGQDGGCPQAGCACPHCQAARSDVGRRRRPACLGIVDPVGGRRWLIDATPAFPDQLDRLNGCTGRNVAGPPDGILLTHAHVGHYAGLVHLGPEVMGASEVPLWAMPRMAAFLESHQPWQSMLEQRNLVLSPLSTGTEVALGEWIRVRPLVVPHRDEFSETIALEIEGPGRTVLWLPDIDDWESWETPLEDRIESYAAAWVDGTFFDQTELPDRDLSEVPHPSIQQSLTRFSTLDPTLRDRIRFVHLNHTNPALVPGSDAAGLVREAGMHVAAEFERWGLVGH